MKVLDPNNFTYVSGSGGSPRDLLSIQLSPWAAQGTLLGLFSIGAYIFTII